MRYVLIPDGDGQGPAFYLAVEEVVARRHPGEDAFFLWQVPPTVIIGRNQVVSSEVDLTYCRQHGISLVRRKSGGGAVFADGGDLMFSYILTDRDTAAAFRRAMETTAGVLRGCGIDARLSGRNDILVDGRKVSGAALYRIGERCIIHNTLLYDVDLGMLERALTPPSEKLAGKGVASVREHVRNVGPLVGLDPAAFIRRTREALCGDRVLPLDEADVREAREIEALLRSDEFIYGNNPRYTLVRRARIPEAGTLEASLELKGDRIRSIRLTGDFFVVGELDGDLLDKLRGLPYRRDAVAEALANTEVGELIRGLTAEGFLDLLFGAGA